MLAKFVRYNLVQVAAYALEFSTFMLIAKIGVHLVLSNCIAKAMAAIFAFFLHKNFTFQKKEKEKILGEIFRYAAMLFVNMALGSLILIVLSKFSEEWLAKILSDISCVGVSFLLVRYVVFKDSKK